MTADHQPAVLCWKETSAMIFSTPLPLLLCAIAGVVSEVVTLGWPERVFGMLSQDPDELLRDRFHRFVFVLSAFYLLCVILLIFSGNERFRLYGIILVINAVVGWLFRHLLLRWRPLQVAGSTLCLILLIDVIRRLVRPMIG
jgi:hypothetical protein